MKVKTHIIGLVFVAILCGPVFGQSRGVPVYLAEISSSDAATLVVKKTGGKVLKVTEEERKGQWVYRVKVLLPEGRVKTLFVSKESGAMGG